MFYGKWSIQAKQFSTKYNPRFDVQGSNSSDGSYPVNGPFTLNNVTGTGWSIAIYYQQSTEGPWMAAQLLPPESDFTVANGLVVSLVGGRFISGLLPEAVLTLWCTNQDPELNPIPTQGAPISFTINKTTDGKTGR